MILLIRHPMSSLLPPEPLSPRDGHAGSSLWPGFPKLASKRDNPSRNSSERSRAICIAGNAAVFSRTTIPVIPETHLKNATILPETPTERRRGVPPCGKPAPCFPLKTIPVIPKTHI
jgi:hypothetical protein